MGSLFVGYNVGVLNLAQDKMNYVYNITENVELKQGIYFEYDNFKLKVCNNI